MPLRFAANCFFFCLTVFRVFSASELNAAAPGLMPGVVQNAGQKQVGNTQEQKSENSRLDESWRSPPAPKSEPKIAAASDEGERAIGSFRIPDNWEVNLFAAEPDVANPVALDVDYQGRVFVIESFRQEKGIEDNRNHKEWLVDDLAAQTIEDRLAYIKKHLGDQADKYTHWDDRIRMLVDSNGDGQVDQNSIFSDRYNTILSGSGAGILSYRGNVYFTCIPDLWLLKDIDRDGIADKKRILSTGYGVRFAFRGHDLHGLIIGPDGRLYFSIGDRGYDLKQIAADGKVTHGRNDPASGAVFRCELDGSRLEVFATGLRNPQELAFDDEGYLFTGDNNSDSGDRARWVYVVHGGDSGWRMHYQYLPDRGPFNREKLWHPFSPETPAYIVPPITNLSDGPSGLAFYPGTGLSSYFNQRFFLCDFRGQKSNSGVRTFRLEKQGAFFNVVDQEQTLWGILATDVHFGPGGKIFASDWVHGWQGEGKGRIYTFVDKNADQQMVANVRKILASDFGKYSNQELQSMLAHIDRRIRMESQFELVRRGEAQSLANVAISKAERRVARQHAMWGLAQIARTHLARTSGRKPNDLNEILTTVFEFGNIENIRLRTAALRIFADIPSDNLDESMQASARSQASELLAQISQGSTDESVDGHYEASVIFAAGQFPDVKNVPHLAAILSRYEDKEPIIRHQCIMALAKTAREVVNEMGNVEYGRKVLLNETLTQSVSGRLASIVALRKLIDFYEMVEFAKIDVPTIMLDDSDSRVRDEAARLVYDMACTEHFDKLADRLGLSESKEFLRRSMCANYRLGQPKNAIRMMEFALNANAPIDLRMESLKLLGEWSQRRELDPALGNYWPLNERDSKDVKNLFEKSLNRLLKCETRIAVRGIESASQLGVNSVGEFLVSIVNDESAAMLLRIRSLQSLHELDQDVAELLPIALDSSDWNFWLSGFEILVDLDPASEGKLSAIEQFKKAVANAPGNVQQSAWRAAGKMTDKESASMIAAALSDTINKQVPAELQLDIVMAAALRKEPGVVKELKLVENALAGSKTKLEQHRLSLSGGNEKMGRKVFFEKTEVSCLRCHQIGKSGGQVGPELTKIGTQKSRDYLLRSIVDPNHEIAENFETVVILDIEGESHTGIIKKRTGDSIEIMDSDGKVKKLLTENIDEMNKGISSMPEDTVGKLTRDELRDLVAYLASLKGQDNGEMDGNKKPLDGGHGRLP